MACKNGRTKGQASELPPGIKAGPFKAPSSPPLTPEPTYKMPEPSSDAILRWVSRYKVLPPSMTTSPALKRLLSSVRTLSTGAPAGTMSQTRLGICKLATKSLSEWAAQALRPSVRLAKLLRLLSSRSKPVTLKPLRSKFRARFSPMTPRPMSPMFVCIDLCLSLGICGGFSHGVCGGAVTFVWASFRGHFSSDRGLRGSG